MPELPEVERARATIAAGALGRRIVAVDDRDRYVCRPHGPDEIAAALIGRALVAAHRRGKSIWVEADGNGPLLGLHLGMAGAILMDAPPDPRGWDRFALDFEDGGRLALLDRRRLSRAVLDPDLERLGPDAAEVGGEELAERVGRGAAPIKARLLDQSVLAGVGNLLADETLWRARLSPLTPAGELSAEELDRLHAALLLATRDAIDRGGVHTGELIPARARGGRCPRCGAVLSRARVGGRTTFWCPREQGEAGAQEPRPD